MEKDPKPGGENPQRCGYWEGLSGFSVRGVFSELQVPAMAMLLIKGRLSEGKGAASPQLKAARTPHFLPLHVGVVGAPEAAQILGNPAGTEQEPG